MATMHVKQVLSNLYGLMMEINFHLSDEEVLAEFQQKADPQIDKHLLKIKQINARLKAQRNKARFEDVIEQVRKLKERRLDELKKLIPAQEQAQLVPLFRKFEELTKNDEVSILEDQELLQLMEVLKNKLDGLHE